MGSKPAENKDEMERSVKNDKDILSFNLPKIYAIIPMI